MSSLYGDLIAGVNANAGTSTGIPFKDFVNGATAARTAPGDTVFWLKTPDPLRIQDLSAANVTFTWTTNQTNGALSAAATINVYTCESAMTASANVTASTTGSATQVKQGSNAATLVFATAFTTGKAAYFATGLLNLSQCTGLSFWFKSSLASAANTFRIDLCTDTIGAVAVHSFTIDEAMIAGAYRWFTFDTGSALSIAIQSIAVTCLLDPGTATLTMDNFFACNSRLHLGTYIGFSTSVGTDYYPLKSVDGTTLTFDVQTPEPTRTAVAIYSRVVARVTASQVMQEAGASLSSRITHSGGWNAGYTTQDGETWVDYLDQGNSFQTTLLNFTTLERFGFGRGNFGVTAAVGVQGYTLTGVQCSGNNTNFSLLGSAGSVAVKYLVLTDCRSLYPLTNTSGYNFSYTSRIKVTNCYAKDSSNRITTPGFSFTGCSEVTGDITTEWQPVTLGCFTGNAVASGIMRLKVTQANGPSAGSTPIDCRGGILYVDATSMSLGAVQTLFSARLYMMNPPTALTYTVSGESRVYIARRGGDQHDARIVSIEGNITQDSGTTFPGTGYSSKHACNTTFSTAEYPCYQEVIVPVYTSGVAVTLTLKTLRDNADSHGRIFVRGGVIAGVPSDIDSGWSSGTINVWEDISVTFTPSETGPVEIELQSYGAHNVYFDGAL